MTDFASLGIRIDSTDAKTAAVDLATLSTAGERTEQQTKKLGGAMHSAIASAGQQRAGFQQLGFQLGDFTTQVSSGTSVTQALAQQLGQTTQALQLMGGGRGALGAVARFLGGPWGIALSVAAIALVPLIGKLFDAGDAAEKAGDKFAGAADQARKLAGATNALRLNQAKIDVNDLSSRRLELEGIISRRPAKGAAGSLGFRLGVGAGAEAELRRVKLQILEQNNLITLAEQQNAALEKSAAITATRTRAIGGGGRSSGGGGGRSGGGGGLTGALSESQRATDAATKATDSFIAKLEEEIARMGKSEQQLRAMEIARAKEGAATEAQRQRIDELNAAREREIALSRLATKVLADLAERRKFLEDAFDGAVEQATKNGEEAFDRAREGADRYRGAIESIVTVLDQVGGRKLGNIAAILGGFATGDFRGATGPVGGLLNILSQGDNGKALIGTFTDKLAVLFGGSGQFKKTLQSVLENGGIGIAAGSLALGNKNSVLGSGVGGALGGALGKTFGPEIAKAVGGQFGKILGNAAGPLGAVLGGVLGGLVGGLFKKTKTGSATLGFSGGDLGITGTGGNDRGSQQQASSLGGSISNALGNIAERLGGTLDGPISLSIGIRKGSLRVDPTGKGRTKGAGVLDFGKDEAAALKFAITDAIKDGAISGLSAGVLALLNKVGSDIEKRLAKAVKFQGVFDQLKERTDPLGFAMEQLGREAASLKKVFAEAGASATEYAQLEQLLALKREDAIKNAGGAADALKAFLLDLNAGPASPLSLRRQKVEAEAALAPFSAAIASAQAARAQADAIKASGGSASAISAAEQSARVAAGKIDQSGFQSAAQLLLGISRGIDGSGAGFFAEFDRIRALTQAGIGLIDSPQDLTPQIVQNTADTAALLVDNNELLKSIDARLAGMNDNGSNPGGWFDATRNFG